MLVSNQVLQQDQIKNKPEGVGAKMAKKRSHLTWNGTNTR